MSGPLFGVLRPSGARRRWTNATIAGTGAETDPERVAIDAIGAVMDDGTLEAGDRFLIWDTALGIFKRVPEDIIPRAQWVERGWVDQTQVSRLVPSPLAIARQWAYPVLLRRVTLIGDQARTGGSTAVKLFVSGVDTGHEIVWDSGTVVVVELGVVVPLGGNADFRQVDASFTPSCSFALFLDVELP